CISVQDMATSNKLIAEIEGKGNFILNWTAKQFAALKRVLYHAEKEAEEISMLGYQPDSGLFAFCNGVFDGQTFFQINSFGIIETPKGTFYIPALSSVNKNDRSEYIHERKFRYLNTPTPLIQWADLMCRAYGHNGRIGICYLIAALFRDIVFDYLDCFPILFLFGPPKTGKSTFRESLLSLFGIPQPAISLGSSSSPKGFARKLGQFANALICFEEYKNTIKRPLIEMLKSMYDGIGYERAQTSNDNRTHATLVNSAVILGGQEMPTKENALFSRVLMLTFSKTKFDDGEKAAFRGLEEMISAGLGNVLLEILRHREVVAAQFGFEFSTVYGHLRRDGKTNHLDERTLANVAAILAPFRVLSGLLDFPFDYEAIYRLMREKVIEQHDQMTKTSEVSEFWQIIDSEEGQSFFRGTHYVVRGEHLYLDFNRAFKIYKEQAIKQQLNHLDKATLESYLTMQPYFERPQGKGETDRLKSRVVMEEGGPQRRCLKFRHESLDLDFIKTKT
ncbi:MAG: hypothetical protein KDD10_21900, partial [Phaeodactylibacter sp.]|nr:hypothetical protein [Phaeodactylibacter sp.]